MTIRPIDMQVNVMKEGEQAKNVEKDKLQQEGQARFNPSIQKEQDEKKETVQNYENASFNVIDEQKRERGGHGGGEEKKGGRGEGGKKKDFAEAKDPDRGNLIDIKS